MILNILNSNIPSAVVGQSHFDDEKVLIPLTPEAQKAFNRASFETYRASNKGLIKRRKK